MQHHYIAAFHTQGPGKLSTYLPRQKISATIFVMKIQAKNIAKDSRERHRQNMKSKKECI